MRRRDFLLAAAAARVMLAGVSLSKKERVDRALRGADVDRAPFSFWHHFGLDTPEAHAKTTLDFHRQYGTDIVKVMSDFAYPKPAGKWYELKVTENPFPQQIRALELIRDGLNGDAYFIETVFNPWNVAEKLAPKGELERLKAENPQALLDALDVITQSQIHHTKRVLDTGASGFLYSVANANREVLSTSDFEKFSAPFDRQFIEAVSGSPLNILHLHVGPGYLDFFHGWPATVINYSLHVSGIPMAEVRRQYSQVLMGGLDEVNFRKLDATELRKQWQTASQAAGKKFILAPGCSVPNDSTGDELSRLPKVLGV